MHLMHALSSALALLSQQGTMSTQIPGSAALTKHCLPTMELSLTANHQEIKKNQQGEKKKEKKNQNGNYWQGMGDKNWMLIQDYM